MKHNGVGLRQLAEKSGVQVETFSRWVTGKVGIPAPRAESICRALGCEISDIAKEECRATVGVGMRQVRKSH